MWLFRRVSARLISRSRSRYLGTQKGYKSRFFSPADLVLMLEAAQRLGRYRHSMHRAINAYKLLIIDEIGYVPMSRDRANLSFQLWRSAMNSLRSFLLPISPSAAGIAPLQATASSPGDARSGLTSLHYRQYQWREIQT